jgi:uncharacterized protein
MEPRVAAHIAEGLKAHDEPVWVIWHGGEPLSCGLKHFASLYSPFASLGHVTHSVQTNATLINEAWCDFFKSNSFHVGISLDGPDDLNGNRVDKSGGATYHKVMEGVARLKQAGVEFHVIAVVDDRGLENARELYSFFAVLGCRSLGINIEEREGVNTARPPCDSHKVSMFWEELFAAWKANPVIKIREFRHVLHWMSAVCGERDELREFKRDIFPTVAWNGDVVVLSPELNGAKSIKYGNFVVGNVCSEPLVGILAHAQAAPYVHDFLSGVSKCKEQCDYFSFCGGGQASNKFYELGEMDGTETIFCRNSKKRLVDSVLSSL